MIWNQSVQRRSAATRVYEQWHGESLSCRIPYERGKWRWFVLGQGRRGPAPLCGPCAHMSRAPLLSLRGCGPRSPSPPLPISKSMGSDGQIMAKWLLDSETGRFCYDRNATVYTTGKSCSRASKWYAAHSKTQIFRGVTVDLPRDGGQGGFRAKSVHLKGLREAHRP